MINSELYNELHNCGIIPALPTITQEYADAAKTQGISFLAVNETLYGNGQEIGSIPKGEGILMGNYSDEELRNAMKNPAVCAVIDTGFLNQDIEEFKKRCQLVRNIALSYGFAHVGINNADEKEAKATADFLGKAFGFPAFDIGTSIMVAGPLEIVKSQFRGKKGHIGIETASVARAIADLTEKGYSVDEGSIQRAPDRRIQSVYLKNDVAGFAWHLLQKR